MKIRKYLVEQFCFIVFRFSIYTLATAVALLLVLGSSTHIKQAFNEANAYQRFVPAVVESAAQTKQTASSVPLSDPTIQKIIEESFPANALQANTEMVINNTYAWLSGNAPDVAFTVNFTANIDRMANNLSNYAMSKLGSRPLCERNPETVDPFTATCQPANFDFAAERLNLIHEIKTNNGFLPKPVLTATDLPKTSAGKTLTQQYGYAPRLFVLLHYAPLILTGTACASALAIVALARKKHQAIRWVGRNIATSSFFIVLSPLVYMYVLPRLLPSLDGQSKSGGASAVISDVVHKLSSDFNNQLILVGVLLVLLGFAIMTLERALQPKSKYIKVRKQSGLTSSEPVRSKKVRHKLSLASLPVQTSEGEQRSSKYQKDKRYRTIPTKEY